MALASGFELEHEKCDSFTFSGLGKVAWASQPSLSRILAFRLKIVIGVDGASLQKVLHPFAQ